VKTTINSPHRLATKTLYTLRPTFVSAKRTNSNSADQLGQLKCLTDKNIAVPLAKRQLLGTTVQSAIHGLMVGLQDTLPYK